ncbi:unnamed protein product [Trifolium pratense]|uniref:Uncharacterized protein n=1 Tax=Trifolium pratense TaxID=57577 RepID=A0ACB0JYR4_TRIPR|nr:unnamed protein product [Trifolium pratense]
MWRIIHNRLPIREALFKRGVICSPLCCLCDGTNESIDHLFMGCDWTKTVWFASNLSVNFAAYCEATISFSEWVSKVIMHHDIEVVQLVLSICYGIWKVRNTRCFEEAELPNALSCWNNAHKSISEFNSRADMLIQSIMHPIPMPDSAIRWTLPDTDFYKLNVDAAGPNNDGNWGLAAVIRDADGCVVAKTFSLFMVHFYFKFYV